MIRRFVMNYRVYIEDLVYICCVSIASMLIGSMIVSIAYNRETRELRKTLDKALEASSSMERYIVARGYAEYVMNDDVIMLKWKE